MIDHKWSIEQSSCSSINTIGNGDSWEAGVHELWDAIGRLLIGLHGDHQACTAK